MNTWLRSVVGFLAVVVTAALLAGGAMAGGAMAGGRRLSAELTGPTTGTGTASLKLNQGLGTVCWKIDLTGVSPLPHAGHIHDVATNGIILTLFGGPANPAPTTTPSAPTTYPASMCVEGVSGALIKEIRQNPEDYYVNLHNTTFPGGVVSGVLSK